MVIWTDFNESGKKDREQAEELHPGGTVVDVGILGVRLGGLERRVARFESILR